ncbi:MAG: RuBisCO large subunit C-terminal-like domain-containing protein [Hyphomicrobiaceae bacterium]
MKAELDFAAEQRFRATYRIAESDETAAREIAHDIAVEQTVEVPLDCVPKQLIAQRLIAEIETVTPVPGGFDVLLSFRDDLPSPGAAGLLNVIFGNVSLKSGIRLVGLELSPRLEAEFAGPLLGIDGVRALLGAHDRPLTATAIKPIGLPVGDLACLAEGYAAGGIDIVKDDHNLIDQRLSRFAERVPRLQEAVTRANARTGYKAAYVPMIAGRFEELDAQFERARAEGIQLVMTAPLLVGPDLVRGLAARHGLGIMAHPSFAGAALGSLGQGISPGVLLGTLFRLFGADISIFPNVGGRFDVSAGDCRDISTALRAPFGRIKPALPSPAGGMGLDHIAAMVSAFGHDTVLLIGGALLRHSPDPLVSAAAFREAVEACTTAPRHALASARA